MIHSHKTASTEGGSNLTWDTHGAWPVRARAWRGFSSSSLSQPTNRRAELRSAEAGQAVDPRVWVGGRAPNMNHAQHAGVQEHWCGLGPALQLPAVGGRMPTEPGMHKHSADAAAKPVQTLVLRDPLMFNETLMSQVDRLAKIIN